jgi:hypothetical protein
LPRKPLKIRALAGLPVKKAGDLNPYKSMT